MATSITASTQSPYSLPLLQDVNYNVSASWPATATSGSTPSIYFANLDWPTVGQFALSVYSSAVTGINAGSSSYVTLQWAPDNATWVTIPPLSASVITAASTAVSQLVLLPPPANSSVGYYVRAQATTNQPSLAGSFGINTVF